MKDPCVQIPAADNGCAPGDRDKTPARAAGSLELRSLHIPGSPLVAFSVWDAGSAQAITEGGAKAIVVDAWSVAAAHGIDEIEHMPIDLYIGSIQRVVASSHLPITVDLSGLYSARLRKVSDAITWAIGAGASGFTISDVVFGCGALRDITDQAAIIAAARATGDVAGDRPFLYARSDVFCQTWPDQHAEGMVEFAVERAHAFADAGADSLLVPGLSNLRLIDRVVKRSPLPVSVMIGETASSIQELSRVGVACVMSGPLPYLKAMSAIRDEVRTAVNRLGRM